jgi:hypothetical protein
MNSKKEEKLKSWLLLFVGLAGIGYQQYTNETNWILLLIFTAMTGVPGLATLISLIKNSSTVLPSSLPQLGASEQDSELSSSESSGDKDG